MAEPWIALAITALVAAISIVNGLYQSSQSKQAAIASEKARGDIASLKLELVEKITDKLGDFVNQQRLKDYIEGHAKEHKIIEQELTRLRDWKEDTDGTLRKNRDREADLTKAVADVKALVETIKERASN